MSEENAALTVTLKGGRDYDASWIVVRGDNPADVTAKLDSLGDVVAATARAASLFQAAQNVAPLTQPEPVQQPQQAAPAPQQQNGWGNQGQQQAAPQQPVQQQPQVGKYGGRLHPEGKSCTACGQTLEYGQTRTGKGQWKCGQYRYNNGNPNEHTLEWAS